MQRGLVGGLDFDDVARASRGVVEDVLVALDDVEIVVRDVLHVEAPAGVAAGAEGVVDHVADAGDAHGAETVEGFGAQRKKFVGPEEVGLFGLGDAEEIAIDAVDGGAGGEAMGDLADEGTSRQVVEGVEGDDVMSEALKCPEAIEGGFLGREAGGVQNLHRMLRFLCDCLDDSDRGASNKIRGFFALLRMTTPFFIPYFSLHKS